MRGCSVSRIAARYLSFDRAAFEMKRQGATARQGVIWNRRASHDRRFRKLRQRANNVSHKELAMTTPRPTFGAFNQGIIPTIACFVDKSTKTPLGVPYDALIAAMQAYVDQHVAPVWGTPAKLVKKTGFVKDAWAMVFLDDADEAGALAYHDLTPEGLPLSKVFVRTTINNGDLVSVSASHELVEMLVDPAINLMSTGPDPKTMYAYESADPVEALSFKVNGIAMSDFVYPSYFENFHKPGSVKFDHLGKLNKPFQILAGGYQIVFKNGKWTELHGSVAKARLFSREDRRQHRSEIRKSSERVATPRKQLAAPQLDIRLQAVQARPVGRAARARA
jgi:hypothetical protein